MKKINAISLAAIALLTFTSCNSKAKLAEAIEGRWASNAEKLMNTGAENASVIRILDFKMDPGKTEGNLTMTAMISVQNVTSGAAALTAPIQITASGVATINGVYQVKDDDEIMVSLDASSMNVTVDPQDVTLMYNVIASESVPEIEALKPGAMRLATQQITKAAQSVFYNVTKIDDIHINNNLMTCEIQDHDLNFTRTQK